MKKFLLVLVALGVASTVAYLLLSRQRETPEGGAEHEIDLREPESHEVAEPGTQFADIGGNSFGSAN